MLKRVLIANRGEIAIRIARAAASLGIELGGHLHAPADSLSLHTRLAGAAREIGAAGGDPVRGLSRHRRRCRRGQGKRQRLRPSGLRLPVGECRLRPALPGRGAALRRARSGNAGAVRRQGRGPRLRPGAGHSGRARRAGGAGVERRGEGAGKIHRLPGDAEGLGRRRRARHARRDEARGDGRRLRALPGRGRGRVRRWRALPGEDRAAAAAYRGPGAGRRPGQCRASLRARLLGAAAQPEGRRDRARAQPRRGAAPAHPGRRGRACPRRALRECRHRRVPGQSRNRASTSSSSAIRASRSSTRSPSR